MTKSQLNAQRRENYKFYRSIGYSVRKATNNRNKTPATMIDVYKKARSNFNESRFAKYRGETPKEIFPKPYRPKIEVTPSQRTDFSFSYFTDYNIPSHILSQMTESNDFFDLEIYSSRLDGLKNHFEKFNFKWQGLMQYLEGIEDLGDWLDALGALYDSPEDIPVEIKTMFGKTQSGKVLHLLIDETISVCGLECFPTDEPGPICKNCLKRQK